MANKLENNGVEVLKVFYSVEEDELGHEYQFTMNLPQAENTFHKLIEFLHRTKEKLVSRFTEKQRAEK